MRTDFVFDDGQRVQRIGLGTMRMADRPDQRSGPTAPIWNPPTDRDELIGFLRGAAEAGVNMFDTADAYALGAGEELLAEALAPIRSEVVIATKIGNTRPTPEEWVPLGRPEYLRQQLELSLRRLRTDRIDLLYLHRIDPSVPLADQLGVLEEARQQGKIRTIGISGVDAAQLAQAREVAPIGAVQNNYSIGDRTHDDIVEITGAAGIAFVAFFPLTLGTAADDPRFAEIAAAHGVAPTRLALSWLLHRGDHILAIPGTTNPTHLRNNLAAADLLLTPDELSALDAAVIEKSTR
ncbi:aldo/keto reductase [Nocardia sp. NBC_00416]|uniref:aldo/keto reductase n=1 Tax=Nocardia sp. NBC_00416 TaxID=2975991 RepID=UPI002E200491